MLVDWLGSTDLEIEFVITDADSGQPVEAAELLVYEYGGFYREAQAEREFTLTADSEGIIRSVCHDDWCIGKTSGLRFTDTYHVYLPEWRLQVSAPGYEASNRVWLRELPEGRRQQQHLGPRRDKLIVRLPMQRAGS
jgi:hypothetical protein